MTRVVMWAIIIRAMISFYVSRAAHVRAVLLKAVEDMLKQYPTTLAQDVDDMTSSSSSLPTSSTSSTGVSGDAGKGEHQPSSSTFSSRNPPPPLRRRLAVLLRVEEKQTLAATAKMFMAPPWTDDATSATEACEHRFGHDVFACLRRSTGAAFTTFYEKTVS